MEWEPWVVGASSYEEFKQKVKKLGFSNIPLSPNPMMGFERMIMDNVGVRTDGLANQKSMIRKRKD